MARYGQRCRDEWTFRRPNGCESSRIPANDNHYHLRVLSGDPPCYGAATSQILAIYENFLVYAISVLLLVYSLFLLKTSSLQKGNAEQGKRKFTVDCFLSLFFARSKPWRLTKNAYPKFSG